MGDIAELSPRSLDRGMSAAAAQLAGLVMPIPAADHAAGATSAILALFAQLHRRLRDEVSGLDRDALNWVPTPGANSIATIVTHLIGSESETLLCVAGLPTDRNREVEFERREVTGTEVRALLDAADALIGEARPRIDANRLRENIALPTLRAEDVRSGLTWLVGNYGHACEHLGHMQLTKQLYLARADSR